MMRIGEKCVQAALDPAHALSDDRTEPDGLFVEKLRRLAVSDFFSVRHEIERQLDIFRQAVPAPAVL